MDFSTNCGLTNTPALVPHFHSGMGRLKELCRVEKLCWEKHMTALEIRTWLCSNPENGVERGWLLACSNQNYQWQRQKSKNKKLFLFLGICLQFSISWYFSLSITLMSISQMKFLKPSSTVENHPGKKKSELDHF